MTQDAYDSKGNVLKVTYPDLSTTTYGAYNSFAEPSSMTDQLGRTTTYTYDSNGNRTVVQDPLTNVTTYTYSSTQKGMLIAQTAPAPLGQGSYTLWSYAYDSDDRQTTIVNALGDTTTKSYSSAGQVTSETDPNGNVTTYSYDPMNRLTGETDAAGTSIAGVTTNTYDAGGNEVSTTDPDKFTTTTAYDAMDRVSTVKNPDGSVVSYTYDSGGNLHTLTDPNGNITTYGYDALNRQTSVTSPSVNASGGVLATTAYDADSEVTGTTDADDRRVTYSYDLLGRQTGETWLTSSGGALESITYTYDKDGEMLTAQDPNSLISLTYNSGGELLTSTESGGRLPQVTLTYGSDPSGDLTSITDNLSGTGGSGQGITTYVYDNALQLTTITQSLGGVAGPQVVMSYDSGGRISQETRTIGGTGDQVLTTFGYDAANYVTGITNSNISGSGGLDAANPASGPIQNKTAEPSQFYTPDPAGRVTSMVYGSGNTAVSYSYDSAGQLTGASGGYEDTYSYDSGGNRNSTGYTTGAGNEMTSGGGYTYTYDNAGNTISKTQLSSGDVWTYSYDYQNRLTSAVEKSSGGTTLEQVTYTYDALSRQIGVDTNGTQRWTVFNGSSADANPYADYTGSALSMRYLYGPAVDEILARTDPSGNTAWYLTDQLGSVWTIVNSSGTVLDSITYGAYGNVLTESSPSSGDRFKFAGMQYDSTPGIYYDHARYYDPNLGRFVSQDPMAFAAGDADLYRYVNNQPTGKTDASGLQAYYRPPAANKNNIDTSAEGWLSGVRYFLSCVIYSTCATLGGIAGSTTGVVPVVGPVIAGPMTVGGVAGGAWVGHKLNQLLGLPTFEF